MKNGSIHRLMTKGPEILIKGISKRFRDGPLVLENISITARSGEIIAVVGPSGCGKSTLLRIIAGLIPPTDGSVKTDPTALRQSFIFQDATLLPWATLEENVALPLRLKGVDRQSRTHTARYWAEQVGLNGVGGYFPRQLSGGMKMRVSIARAFSTEPNLLLLDEPFGALDAITRNRLNEDLLRLHEAASWTAFFVTHSVTEAVFLSHRMIFLSNEPGAIHSVMENPLPWPRDAHTRESILFQEQVAAATVLLNHCLPDETRQG